MELKGTKTEQNLKAALAGESIARNKYTYFANQARKEGNEELAVMLERLAINESTHTKFWYTAIHGPIQDSMSNLRIASAGELEEWSRMYPDFAKTAREEGFEDLAVMFEHVADIEKNHEKQFMEMIMKMSAKKTAPAAAEEAPVPQAEGIKTEKVGYRCVFCGATFDTRPDVCPVCQAIGSFEAYTYMG